MWEGHILATARSAFYLANGEKRSSGGSGGGY
jgi:hypothetical protein